MKKERSIIWRRLDIPGQEFARISSNRGFRRIDGTAILVYEASFCKLDYSIKCDSDWRTLSAKVNGWVGERVIEISIVNETGWSLNGKEIPAVEDCLDLDLNFSPVTNTLPIRRLNLAVGEKAAVRAAWLRFPSFQLEPLAQVYERTGQNLYHYESGGGKFKADLEIDEAGLVKTYANLWRIESGYLS